MGHELYEKLYGLFPEFMDKKYSYMRLESTGFEPLSLEWIFGDRISVMHTFSLNGDLCYDPMMEFLVNSAKKTLTARTFEQSLPPLYQYHDDEGLGWSVDGTGINSVIKDLERQLSEFAELWFNNISEQGFKPVRAILWNGGGIDDEDIEVTFDDNHDKTETASKADEYELLNSDANMFGIYQVRDDIENARNYRFASLEELQALGLDVDGKNYKLVYTAPFEHRIEFLTDRYPLLNKIFEQFNINHPANYKGRSVSVSDVIVLHWNHNVSAHFVDSKGFVEISGFFGTESQPCIVTKDVVKEIQERMGL